MIGLNLPSTNGTANNNNAPATLANQNANAGSQAPAQIVIPGNYEAFPVPPAMSQVVASAAGGGAAAVTAYFGNEDAFNVTPTNNGSGAGSVVKIYGDGYSGKGYNKIIDSGQGVQCYGFTIQYNVTAGGAQDPSGLTTSNPTILTANLVGQNQIPRGILLSAGQRNTQFLSGVMTVQFMFMFNALTQFAYGVPVGDTATLTLLTAPF